VTHVDSEVQPGASRVEAPAESGHSPIALVVDDEPSVGRLIALTLEDVGFRPVRAGSASDAMDFIEASTPDVITLDLRLPDLNGRQLFRRIRETGIEAPIVIVSAYGARAAQRELGADAAVEKPFDPDQIQRLVLDLVPDARDAGHAERS
jgi:DNA-binding response OmpR family regulator